MLIFFPLNGGTVGSIVNRSRKVLSSAPSLHVLLLTMDLSLGPMVQKPAFWKLIKQELYPELCPHPREECDIISSLI